MPAGVPPPNFQGKKGRSGRKAVYEELNKAEAINKLWEKVNQKVQAGIELDDFEKELVKVLLPKTIKTQVGLEGLKPLLIEVKRYSDDDENRKKDNKAS